MTTWVSLEDFIQVNKPDKKGHGITYEEPEIVKLTEADSRMLFGRVWRKVETKKY